MRYPKIGDKNLSTLAKANRFSDWLFSTIKPFIKGEILEIGSGRGTYSSRIIHGFPSNKVFLSDIDSSYIKELKRKYQTQKNINVIKLDVGYDTDFAKMNQQFDTIVAINILEHVEDDYKALKNMNRILKKTGNLIVLIPAHKFLFNCIDESVGHFRRYNKQEIIHKASHLKIKVKKIFYFNSLSILAWYINGVILKRALISEGSLLIFDKLIPIISFIEKHFFRQKIGISLIAVLRKI